MYEVGEPLDVNRGTQETDSDDTDDLSQNSDSSTRQILNYASSTTDTLSQNNIQRQARHFVPQADEVERVRRNLFSEEREIAAELSDPPSVYERPLSPAISSSAQITQRNAEKGSSVPNAVDLVENKRSHDSDEDEGQQCSICFEPWTNSGRHRIASLRCGHLFGHACIDRWMSGHDGRCPQCNQKSRRTDIRPLYTRCIKALDTTERDHAIATLEKEREVRRRLELELAQSRLRCQQAHAELGRLREQIDRKATQTISDVESPTKKRFVGAGCQSGGLSLVKTVNLCRQGNCRVMCFLDYCSMVLVSQPNVNRLFPGFGLKKLNSLEYRAYELIAVHTKAIRDIASNPVTLDGLVLTASMDKTLKLTNIISNAVVHSFQVDVGAWSCAWNVDNPFQFFAGLQNGKVLLFDTRGPSEAIRELVCGDRGSPVSSLQYVKMNPLNQFSCGGLIVGRLDGCFFLESCSGGDDFRVHPLSLAEGPYTSVSLEPTNQHIMMTCRPNVRYRNVRHLVCELSRTVGSTSACECNVVQTFYGGETNKMLSRGRLVRSPLDDNSMLACVGDESSSSLLIWDVGSGSKFQPLPVEDAILDICPISVNNEHFLAALTEKDLNVFKWQTI